MRLARFFAAVAVAAMAFAAPALAVNPNEMLKDSTLEHRARELSKGLRCLVCQNQSIDDSDAELARDLRIIVRERLQKGDSDDEVMQFVVDRYGDYVLLKPPFKAATAVLWFGPLLLFLGAVAAVWGFYRRRPQSVAEAPAKLTPEEERKLKKLLGENS